MCMHGHISIQHKSHWIIITHCTISNRYSDSHYLYIFTLSVYSYLCYYNGAHKKHLNADFIISTSPVLAIRVPTSPTKLMSKCMPPRRGIN